MTTEQLMDEAIGEANIDSSNVIDADPLAQDLQEQIEDDKDLGDDEDQDDPCE
jgi:hypothetical protein